MFGLHKVSMITKEEALRGRATALPVPEKHFVSGARLTPPFPAGMELATFGMGCFWGEERKFWQLPGVYSTSVGYAGGFTPNPTYEEVCSGMTGHTEAVRVVFDPAKISYEELLRVFFTVAHDPTERDRQGPDVGSQYRSVVFYRTPQQQAAAVAMIAELERATAYPRPIVTEVMPFERFFPAEAYHQDYLAHHLTNPYIVYNDLPKLKRLEERFPKLYQRP